MNLRKLLTIIVLTIITHGVQCSSPPPLSHSTTYLRANDLLRSHIKYKEINEELCQRILSNFIDELDPTKIYFLHHEIACWLNPSQSLLKECIQDFNEKKFNHFESIYQLMVDSINRTNVLQDKIAKLPVSTNEISLDTTKMEWTYSPDELLQRLKAINSLQRQAALNLELDDPEQYIQRIYKRQLKKQKKIVNSGNKYDQKKQMLAIFLKSLASSLDSHSYYFTPDEANQFMIDVQQRLFGIGALLQDDLSGFTVTHIVESSPAALSNALKIGDKIIAVNGEGIVGLDIEDAVKLIRGAKGTKVSLTLLRKNPSNQKGQSQKLTCKITRDEIVLKDSRFEVSEAPFADGVIAHIRLFSFYQDPVNSSYQDIKNSIEALFNKTKLHGIILDLRSNTGGLLPQAVDVASLFVKKGVIVSLKDSSGKIKHLRSEKATPVWNGPLVILINKESASAAEIVAQTLQDFGRAIIVGDDHTWGKGSYQLFTLGMNHSNKVNQQGEFKVTQGLYYTVSGKSPQLNGAKSDIVVPGELQYADIGERHAKFPLAGDQIPSNFVDNYEDLSMSQKKKNAKKSLDLQQQKLNTYTPFVQILKSNSDSRIKANKNYQIFLSEIQKDFNKQNTQANFGLNDLQFEESQNIMKDLVMMLEKYSKKK